MNLYDFQEFFERLKPIIDRNKYAIEERKEKGDFFNVFSILGMEKLEVKTHSAFLSELLKPYGTHGLGNKFLSEFINIILPTNKRYVFPNSKINVKPEHIIGKINEDEGGIIDIFIETDSLNIIIENKIEAEDQPKQLIRYYNYANKCKKDFVLLYLTLDGKQATTISTIGKNLEGKELSLLPVTHYHCISYKDNIRKWLERCHELSANFPLVRETIKQYINLIKKITNTENNMGSELIDFLCKNKGNQQYTANIVDTINIDELKIHLMEEILQNLTNDLGSLLDCECTYEINQENAKKTSYNGDIPSYFIIPNKWKIKSNNDCYLCFGLYNNGEFGLYTKGIDKESDKICQQTKKIKVNNTFFALNNKNSRIDGAVPLGCIKIENASNFAGRVSSNTKECIIKYIVGLITDIQDLNENLMCVKLEGTINDSKIENLAAALPIINLTQKGKELLNEINKTFLHIKTINHEKQRF